MEESKAQSRVPEPPPPVAIAMLVCDYVLRTIDGKNCLVGIFDLINASSFPATHPRLFVYVKLADGYGSYRLRTQFVDVSRNRVLSEASAPDPLVISNPLRPAEVVFQQDGLLFPQAGRYEFRLYANDMFVGHTTMHAVQIEPPQPKG